MEYRPTDKPDRMVECDCGHTVLESDMQWVFGENTDTSICDECNDLEAKEKAKPIVEDFFVTLGRILRP